MSPFPESHAMNIIQCRTLCIKPSFCMISGGFITCTSFSALIWLNLGRFPCGQFFSQAQEVSPCVLSPRHKQAFPFHRLPSRPSPHTPTSPHREDHSFLDEIKRISASFKRYTGYQSRPGHRLKVLNVNHYQPGFFCMQRSHRQAVKNLYQLLFTEELLSYSRL